MRQLVLTLDGGGTVTISVPEALRDGGYTLPHATETTRGGVHGATQIQAEANAGTTVLGWTNTRLRQLLAVALATASLAQAQSVVGTTRLIWTVSRLNEFVSHLLPTATGAEAQSTGNEIAPAHLVHPAAEAVPNPQPADDDPGGR